MMYGGEDMRFGCWELQEDLHMLGWMGNFEEMCLVSILVKKIIIA